MIHHGKPCGNGLAEHGHIDPHHRSAVYIHDAPFIEHADMEVGGMVGVERNGPGMSPGDIAQALLLLDELGDVKFQQVLH